MAITSVEHELHRAFGEINFWQRQGVSLQEAMDSGLRAVIENAKKELGRAGADSSQLDKVLADYNNPDSNPFRNFSKEEQDAMVAKGKGAAGISVMDTGSAGISVMDTGSAGTVDGGDPYAAFKAKFKELTGRDITLDEQNDSAFVQTLSNALFTLMPLDRQMSFSGERLSQLDNPSLKKIIDFNPQVLGAISADRLVGKGKWDGVGFSRGDVGGFITQLGKLDPAGQLVKDLSTAMGIAPSAGDSAGAGKGPANSDQKGYIHDPNNPDPNSPWIPGPGVAPTGNGQPGLGPSPIPKDTHGWVSEIGAQDWYYKKIASGMKPEQITQDMLRADMKAVWDTRKADPKFADVYKYAQQYYASTGFWPTEVEYNRYTQNIKDAPNILPDGSGLIPKDSGKAAGDKEKWKVPTDPLPPGYEWRFSSDGTPIQYDITPETKDLFSGWFQDPKTGNWNYDPRAGAADYLTYNKDSQKEWGDIINGFVNRTGRLPTLEEARNAASTLWSRAGTDARDRAQRFADLYGFFPTPYELEYGPAKDTDANTGGGGQGAAGQGQVPVFVPGIGTVLVQGESVGKGGFVFDPFQGIPGSVRPWVKELLNGRVTLDQIPQEMKAWAGFALNKFQDQMPHLPPEQIPWGVPGPNGQAPDLLPEAVTKESGKAQFLSAYKQLNPTAPDPTSAQLDDVSWLSQQDTRAVGFLDGKTLKQFPLDKIALLDNKTITDKLDLATIGGLPDDRLLGIGVYKGSGFDLSILAKLPNERLQTFPSEIIAQFPNERLATFPKDILNSVITDPKRRGELGLDLTTDPTTEQREAFDKGGILGYSKSLQSSGTTGADTVKVQELQSPSELYAAGTPSKTGMADTGVVKTDITTGIKPGTPAAAAASFNIAGLQAAFGTKKGDSTYNADYDKNNDGYIDIMDFSIALKEGQGKGASAGSRGLGGHGDIAQGGEKAGAQATDAYPPPISAPAPAPVPAPVSAPVVAAPAETKATSLLPPTVLDGGGAAQNAVIAEYTKRKRLEKEAAERLRNENNESGE